MSVKKFVLGSSILVVVFFLLPGCKQQVAIVETRRPNILFIAVDDLKPTLGGYGDTVAVTPNIDKLAAAGTVFMQNYCQQAICGPSRASLLTGMRPDYTRVYDNNTLLRAYRPDILTLPEYFKANGYFVSGIGKILHPRVHQKEGYINENEDARLWSEPYVVRPSQELDIQAFYPYFSLETQRLINLNPNKKHFSTGCADVPDTVFKDGVNALQAVEYLHRLKGNPQPFFLALGFHKPHLPLVAPKKYWDFYQREEMPLATFRSPALNSPYFAYHKYELPNYLDIPNPSKQDTILRLSEKKQKELIHGYYAAVSYIDAQIGLVLNALDSLDLSENTIIVLWGDHGWHLGDHGIWSKFTNFEQATRSPLIISIPGHPAAKTYAPTEFVDIFPTLCALTGLPIPAHLQGKSLQPLLKNPKASVKKFSVSQCHRSTKGANLSTRTQLMGYSLRNRRYRYTLWLVQDKRGVPDISKKGIYESELYDYSKDPHETMNVVANTSYLSVAQELQEELFKFLIEQNKENY